MSDKNLEFYSIIWLGNNPNEQIRSICNHLIIFHNEKQCFDYLQKLIHIDWQRFIFIIQDKNPSDLISQIIDFESILIVYILTNNNNNIWTKNNRKINNIFNQFDELIQQFQIDQNQREYFQINEILPWIIFNSKSPNNDCIFIQLVFRCLLISNSFNQQSNFIEFCRNYYQTNPWQLNLINEFQHEYSSNQAHLWLTKQPTFLSRLLNQSLRTRNFQILFYLNFFIQDLNRNENITTTIRKVYRGQIISKTNLDLLIQSIGQFISINTFFLTNSNRQLIRNYLLLSNYSNNTERILFEINSTNELNLFQIGSIFRLIHIEKDSDNIWNIKLLLTTNKEHELEINLKQKLTYFDQLSLPFLLDEYQQYEQAELIFQLIIKQLTNDENNLLRCYHALGEIYLKQNKFEQSLEYFQKCLDRNDINLALSYNSIGVVYTKQNEYNLALESYEKAIKILENYFDNEHLDLAMCFNNIGIVYQQVKNYSEALEYYHKSWNIRQKFLLLNDPLLGQSHICIGNIHYSLKHYDLAFEHFNSALEIFSQISSQQRDIGIIYRNMGLIYRKKNDIQQARSYFEKSANIFRNILPMNQSDLNQIERILQHL